MAFDIYDIEKSPWQGTAQCDAKCHDGKSVPAVVYISHPDDENGKHGMCLCTSCCRVLVQILQDFLPAEQEKE